VYKFRGARSDGRLNSAQRCLTLSVVSTELVSYHRYGAYNFDVALRDIKIKCELLVTLVVLQQIIFIINAISGGVRKFFPSVTCQSCIRRTRIFRFSEYGGLSFRG
jgi:hypothetical protein